MDSGVIKELFVALGFKVDGSSQARFEQAAKASEEKVTAANIAEAAKRLRSAEREAAGRVAEAVAAGAEITEAEKKLLLAQDKLRQESDKKEEDRRKEAQKRAEDRHKKALNDVQAFGLQVVAVATKVTLAIEGIALGVVRVTDKAAQAFERLNYASQRIGASAQGMNAFAYASAQLGSSVGEANQSLQAFGDRIKTFPGMAGALEKMGVQVRDAKGQMLEAEQIAANFGEHLRKVQAADPRYGRANALALAEANGIDRNQAMTMMDPRFGGLMGEYKRTQAKIGANDNDAAQSGTAFEQSMRRLLQVLTDISTKVETSLFKKLQPQLDELAKWATENGSKIADDITTIAEKFIAWAAAIGKWLASVDWKTVFDHLDRLFKSFDDIARRLTGQDGLTAAFAALGAVLATKVLGPLAKIVQLMGSLIGFMGSPVIAALLGIPAAGAAAGAMNASHVDDFGREAGTWAGDPNTPDGGAFLRHRKAHSLPSLGKRLWDWGKKKLGIGGVEAAPGQGASGISSDTKLSDLNQDQRNQLVDALIKSEGSEIAGNNNPGNVRYAGQSGARPGNGGFAMFPTREAGVAAIHKQLFESKLYAGLSIGDAMEKYSPRGDGANDPVAKTKFIAGQIGGAAAGGPVAGRAQNVNPVLLAMIRRVQELTGEKLSISSGFRTPDQNKDTGGAEHSLHMRGYAADLHSDAHPKSDRAFWENVINPAMAKAADEFKQPYRWGGVFGGRYLNDNNHFDLTVGGPSQEALNKLADAGKVVVASSLAKVGAAATGGAVASLAHPRGQRFVGAGDYPQAMDREGTDHSVPTLFPHKTKDWAAFSAANRHGGAKNDALFPPAPALPTLPHPAGHPTTNINNSRTRGDVSLNQTFNVSGTGTVHDSMHAAKLTASRGAQDLIRNMAGAET